MPNIIDTSSNWSEFAKQYKQQGEEKSWWEQWLTGIRTGYSAAEQLAQTQAQVDISGAFQKYRQQQLQLQQASQLEESYRQTQQQNIRSALSSIYSQRQAQLAEDVGELQQQAIGSYQQAQARAEEMGANLQSVYNYLYEHAQAQASETETDKYTLENAFRTKDQGGLEHWKLNVDTGKYELTPEGEEWLDKEFNQIITSPELDTTSFYDYLREQNPELADWYIANKDLVLSTGGERVRDEAYTADEALYRAQADTLKKAYETFTGMKSNKQFESFEEEYNYYDDQYKKAVIASIDVKDYDINANMQSDLAKLFNVDLNKIKVDNVGKIAGNKPGQREIHIDVSDLSNKDVQKLLNMGAEKDKNVITLYLDAKTTETTGLSDTVPGTRYMGLKTFFEYLVENNVKLDNDTKMGKFTWKNKNTTVSGVETDIYKNVNPGTINVPAN